MLVCFLGLSVSSSASTVYRPDQHPFVHEENGHYVLDVDVKASQFTDEQLTFWNSFMDAFMGNTSEYVPFIIYNKGGNELIFSLGKLDSYYIYYSNYSYHFNSISDFPGCLTTLSIDISSGTVISFVDDYTHSKIFTITYQSSIYVFWGYGDLVSHDSRNGNNKDKINYVDWDGMRLQVQDDLGTEEPEEPDPPSSSEPSESIPDLPKPDNYNPTLPTIPTGDGLYVPYDTAVWDTFLERTKQNIGSATNIGFLIFGIAVVWSILTRLVKRFTKP